MSELSVLRGMPSSYMPSAATGQSRSRLQGSSLGEGLVLQIPCGSASVVSLGTVRRLNDVKQPLVSNELSVLRGMPSSRVHTPLLTKVVAASTRVSGVLQCAERDAQLACACLAGFLIFHGTTVRRLYRDRGLTQRLICYVRRLGSLGPVFPHATTQPAV